mmetsp:Transcript_16262/g.20791  ORF Transcript_16262/g.20791 Transcript_16262/m.20791 type:complete len:197 (+) Transcript_16262:119-709(+)
MQISFLAVCMLAAFGFAQAFVPATNFNGVARAQVASSKAPMQMMAKIASKEEWVPVLKTDEIAPGELVPVETDGLQLLVIADFDGSIYASANICPHLGTPMDQGSLGDGTIICPLHKSAFSLETGELAGDWCPFPPLLGPLVLGKLEPPKNLAVVPVRAKGNSIEVLINRNLKAQFESKYWSGLLDAQGKATGDYY